MERLNAIRNEILSYQPGTAVPCDDKRVVFPPRLAIVDDNSIPMSVYAMRYLLYGEEKADELGRADERQTSTENQQELWITNYIYVIKTSLPHTEEREGAIRDLAEKVGCMVKIVNTLNIEVNVKEIKQIKEITGRFPVCAILHNDFKTYLIKAKDALERSNIDYCVVPFRSDRENFPWLDLLYKCLKEGDRVLAANDQKKICKNPRCESFYEKIKKELEEANQEKRSLQQLLASPEGTNRALDKALEESLENWKERTKLQLENEIQSAEQQNNADTPQQM